MKDVIWDDSNSAYDADRIAGVHVEGDEVHLIFDTGYTCPWNGDVWELFELLEYPTSGLDAAGGNDE